MRLMGRGHYTCEVALIGTFSRETVSKEQIFKLPDLRIGFVNGFV